MKKNDKRNGECYVSSETSSKDLWLLPNFLWAWLHASITHFTAAYAVVLVFKNMNSHKAKSSSDSLKDDITDS